MDCVIGLLHSSVIDVDRLDYIIRDAKTMGYQSVSVDYQRLLGGIVLVMDSEYCFRSGFHKNAVSIIENAVYAHDIEKKWIQGHPAILYDSYLIRQSIEFLENMVSKKEGVVSTLFSYDSLSETGSHFGDIFVRYLCDTDVLHLMKNVYYEENPYSKEYFNRSIRRHPVWKSEAEYRSLFTAEDRNMLTKAIRVIYDKDGSSSARVNREMIQTIEENIIEEEKGKGSTNRIKKMEKRKKFCEALLTLCESCNAQQDIVLLSTSFFKSNFEKGKVQRLLISFPGNSKTPELKDVSSTLSSAPSEGDTLVYIFYYPKKGTERLDTLKFTQGLISEFSRIQEER